MATISTDTSGALPRFHRTWLIAKWLALFAVMTILWWAIIIVLRPPQAGVEWQLGSLLLNFAPPLLATLLCWAVVRSATLAAPVALPTTAAGQPVVHAVHLALVTYRLGARAVMTPHGDTASTLGSLLNREAAFALDRGIRHPDGSPAHAAVIRKLDLQPFGIPSDSREAVPRIGAMLKQILDELHLQQLSLLHKVEGAPPVFCLLSPAFLARDPNLDVVRNAWGGSAWAERECDLRPVANEPLALAKLINALQRGEVSSTGGYVLILAADSMVDPVQLAPALATRQIFSSSALQGWIPSEGAAGLVLINPLLCPESQWLSAPVLGAAAGSGIVEPDEQPLQHALSRALANALSQVQRKATDVGMLLNDADHRSYTSIDIFKAMNTALPHLDLMKNQIAPMEFAGHLGAASDTINLALAGELSFETGQVVGLLSRSDRDAVAIVTMPAP